jgi:hypothetical protein
MLTGLNWRVTALQLHLFRETFFSAQASGLSAISLLKKA